MLQQQTVDFITENYISPSLYNYRTRINSEYMPIDIDTYSYIPLFVEAKNMYISLLHDIMYNDTEQVLNIQDIHKMILSYLYDNDDTYYSETIYIISDFCNCIFSIYS